MKPPAYCLNESDFKTRMLEVLVEREIEEILDSRQQPTASELLQGLEKKFQWPARQVFRSAIRKIRGSKRFRRFDREYFQTILSEEEIDDALRGGTKPVQEHKSTLDDLARKSIAYRNSGAFREMIEFVAKFREYAPYNNMLVKIQNPTCGFYATERDWGRRFNRHVVDDARPC